MCVSLLMQSAKFYGSISHIRFPQAFNYAMRVPQIMAVHAKQQQEQADSEADALSRKQQDAPPPTEEAPKIENISLAAASSDSGTHLAVVDAAPTSMSAPDHSALSAPPVSESIHDAAPSSSVEVVSGESHGSSASAEAFPIQENVEDPPALALEESRQSVSQLSADVEVYSVISAFFHISVICRCRNLLPMKRTTATPK